MAYVLSSVSGNLISAASAGFAPTNSADVSAIASAYQVVSATATQLYAGTAYVTSVNDNPLSASRAGQAANASMANSAYYDGTGRLISALPDSATVSAIASSYAESAASSKLDESATADFYSTSNPSGFITGVDLSDYATTAYVDSSISGKLDSTAQVVTAVATSDFNGLTVVTGINSFPLNAVKAGYADYAGQADTVATSFMSWYATTADVAAKQDTLTFGYNTADQISSIDGSALGGMDEAAVSAIASAYAESAASSKQDTLAFGYNAEDKISSINGSSLAGEGGGGGLVTAIGTSTSGITSINNSGLVDTAALRSSDYSSLYVQEPLYISASGDSSYIGISGGAGDVDSATCSAIASAYAESAVSSVSGNYYTTANESGYALSSDVSATVDLVGTQSANWGGSALALSAGPGVTLTKSGDALLASTDETVLFSGSNSGMVATNLSEPLSSFNSFKICFNPFGAGMSREWKEFSWDGSSDAYTVATFHHTGSDNLAWFAAFQPNSNGTTLTPTVNKLWVLGSTTVQDRTQMHVYRVIGINRTAGV